jgi:hypothetical protein
MTEKPNRACFSLDCINYDTMRRFALGPMLAGMVFFHVGIACAQDSLQALKEELKEAKDAHDQMTTQALSNFFGQVDPAMGSPDAAVALYQQAGGTMPEPTPVITQNENETATEKANRLALDQATTARVGAILQLQCGMLHYAALFVTKPDQPGLKDQWVAWLKSAAPAYPQAVGVPPAPAAPGNGDSDGHHHKKDGPGGNKPPAPFNPSDLKGKAMKDTVISKFLAFNAWGDKEQGGWAVKDLPKLYRANVLEPLRATPTAATLTAWDTYIAMANADEPDNDKWAQVDFPPLQFDRACDDYAAAPGTEKLEGLVNLIKANPTNTHADEWITRVSGLMDDYKAKHGGAPAPPPTTSTAPMTAPSAPGVTVTTVQQGDATIITTHSNTAPVAPTPPQ